MALMWIFQIQKNSRSDNTTLYKQKSAFQTKAMHRLTWPQLKFSARCMQRLGVECFVTWLTGVVDCSLVHV